eukprot:8006365-Pyramimonas_sp.AAC.1
MYSNVLRLSAAPPLLPSCRPRRLLRGADDVQCGSGLIPLGHLLGMRCFPLSTACWCCARLGWRGLSARGILQARPSHVLAVPLFGAVALEYDFQFM